MNQKALKRIKNNEKGLVLIEAIVALALIGIIAAGFLGAVGTSYKSTSMTMGMTTAESLARSQMEYIKKQPYTSIGAYDTIEHPTNYAINWTVVELATGKQEITIIVNHSGETAIVLEGYKVNR
ncbi:hypothetical protein ACFLXY_09380 [Chloroflexota bacterium]